MKKSLINLKKKVYLLPGWLRLGIFIICLSIPVVVWVAPFVLTGNKISYMDNDYYLQLYEALRITIVKYHQFPWVNSWMVGGVPLFGNAQLGFLSLQVPLVLLFGTVIGFKISWLTYYLLGFWGMYLLLNKSIKANKVTSSLLAYVFIFCGFFAAHVPGGHYTFALYFFAPWTLWLYFSHIDDKYGWIALGAAISLLILSSPHYAAIQTLLVLAVLIPVNIICTGYIYRVVAVAKSLLVIGVLVVYRMFFVYQYSSDYPRASDLLVETPLHLKTLLKALLFQPKIPIKVLDARWGWGETVAGLGFLLMSVFLLCTIIYTVRIIKTKKLKITPLLIWAGTLLALLIAKGDFGPLSPFALIKHLPVLSQMRIPGRWLIWVVLGILCFIASVKLPINRYARYVIYGLVFAGVCELAYFNHGFTTAPIVIQPQKVNSAESSFEQYYHFQTNTNYDPKTFTFVEYLYEATSNNVGQVIAAESLLDTRTLTTIRCGVNEGCPFVMSRNANVDYWSPNKIELTRTGEGVIVLNMNPSSYWLVNGKRIFANDRVAEPSKQFIISDSSQKIVIEAVPRYSIEYWLDKFSKK